MDSVVEAFKKLSVAGVSDAMDRLGVVGQCLGIQSINQGNRMAGRAFTIKYIPCGIVKGTVGDYIDDVPAGDVVVLDNAGRLDCTVWGDILTAVAHKRGVAGTVVHGVCRDVARLAGISVCPVRPADVRRRGGNLSRVHGPNCGTRPAI
jgi:regulator of RNase E activity RraA